MQVKNKKIPAFTSKYVDIYSRCGIILGTEGKNNKITCIWLKEGIGCYYHMTSA